MRKLGLDSLGPQDPLLALPVLKEALPLSASSSRRPTEQSRAPRHTQHLPRDASVAPWLEKLCSEGNTQAPGPDSLLQRV